MRVRPGVSSLRFKTPRSARSRNLLSRSFRRRKQRVELELERMGSLDQRADLRQELGVIAADLLDGTLRIKSGSSQLSDTRGIHPRIGTCAGRHRNRLFGGVSFGDPEVAELRGEDQQSATQSALDRLLRDSDDLGHLEVRQALQAHELEDFALIIG